MLVQKELEKRHGSVCRYINWSLCENMVLKEHHSSMNMSKIELLKTKWNSVLTKLDNQVLVLLIKRRTGEQKGRRNDQEM